MKRITVLIVIFCMCVLLIGCAPDDALNSDIEELEARVSELKAERDALINEITDIKIESGTAKYIVTFNISQTHFTLDLGQHFKDAMNDISIQIPVDKEYYDALNIGDTIADDFRIGSLIFKGSFGNWDITVEDKYIQ